MQNTLFDKYNLGCNYWASNAGCFMWQQWDEEVVAKDFQLLASYGLTTLRVFPLWSDFQPLKVLCGEFGQVRQVRAGELPTDNTPEGRACVDVVMAERFGKMCSLADKHGIKLTVMLLTGWMSGRQFKPEPLQSLNVYTDPFALKWQVKYVDYMVNKFKDKDAIAGWGLGNESNIMSQSPSCDASFAWTALIANTIRAADPSRPVISGMHGLSVFEPQPLPWLIEDQGKLCDILTTHPYSVFIPHCDIDPLLSVRNAMLPDAQSALYCDIGGKPCMVEELGDIGRAMTDALSTKKYMEKVLFSNWAHDGLGTLWWCAFQQSHIKNAPYDWFEFEQDLGMFEKDRTPKPVVDAFTDFNKFLKSIPDKFAKLPARKRDAVCILTHGQDNWAAALSSFILAKQAGIELKFVSCDEPLPDSQLYLLPGLCGFGPMPTRTWNDLNQKIAKGATLYISNHNALLSNLKKLAGIKILSRSASNNPGNIHFADGPQFDIPSHVQLTSTREGGTAQISQPRALKIIPAGADVLAHDSAGNPAFTQYAQGKGSVYFLNFPLELIAAAQPDSFENDTTIYSHIYNVISKDICENHSLKKLPSSSSLGLTFHPINKHREICIGVDYSGDTKNHILEARNCSVEKIYYGNIHVDERSIKFCSDDISCFMVELKKE